MYAIGLDSGTQGTKALIVDFNGEVKGRGSAPHRMREGLKPGESEQEPQEWIGAFEKALSQALKESKINPSEVASLGVSAQQHGFVPLGIAGRPLRPAKLWNDTSTLEETEYLLEKLGGKKGFIDKLGINLAVGYTASKILWLKRKESENYKKLFTVLLPHNYINYYLTGKLHMEYGDASGTGLMDIRHRKWSEEAVNAIDPELRSKLPPLFHPSEPVGVMKEDIASSFNMDRVLISSGGGDNMMGAVGTGNVKPGVCTLSLGTSGTIYSYFEEPFVDPEGEIAAFCDSTGGWLPLLCTMNVTNTTELLKEFLGLTNEELEELASQAPPGAKSLVFLPFIDGERVPVLPFATGVFFGLNRKNFTAHHLARSVLEGTVLNLGYGFQRMKSLGLKPGEIRATGGGSKSRLWLQVVANVFRTPVRTLKEKEGAAFGAALQSMWCYLIHKGEKVSIADITGEMVRKEGRAVEPEPRTFPVYEFLQQRFNSLWRTLAQEFKAHRRKPGS
ncbi:MAG: xylulokinase [Candidatus Aminicenantales bacterium]